LASDHVESNFLRLLHRLEDPRVSIYLLLLKHNILSREAIKKKLALSEDEAWRALGWLVKGDFISRSYLLEDGKRVAAYYVRGVNRVLTLPLGDSPAFSAVGSA